jgi:hypothetical protein
MRRTPVISLLLLCLGCAAKKPVTPQFAERHCPETSVRHVVRYNEKLMYVCVDNRTQGIFELTNSGCNPYQDVDCDEAAKEKPRKIPWWKFWARRNVKPNDTD